LKGEGLVRTFLTTRFGKDYDLQQGRLDMNDRMNGYVNQRINK